ncbi:MAG: hypothetical protein RL498_624, partial [Pseudomonadota bacterium]
PLLFIGEQDNDKIAIAYFEKLGFTNIKGWLEGGFTSWLNADKRYDLVIEVQRLVKTRGITALWVTHRLEELNYSDGAFLLENGQVVGQGDPEPLKRRLMQKELKG